jgi:HNH endonuclease
MLDPQHTRYMPAMGERLKNYRVNQNGCHIWGGYIDRNGYGRVYDQQQHKVLWVHRVSYEIYKGPIPALHEIDHTCQTPPCINPDCLDAVTKIEHVARTMRRLGKDDAHRVAAELRRLQLTYTEISQVLSLADKASAHAMVQSAIRKGLINIDDVPPAKRLTQSERDDIKDLYFLGVPQPVLAECYGIDSSQVSRIISGRTNRRI